MPYTMRDTVVVSSLSVLMKDVVEALMAQSVEVKKTLVKPPRPKVRGFLGDKS